MTTLDECDDHQPAPSGHAPRLTALTDPRTDELALCEEGDEMDGPWIQAKNPVEVRQ